MIQSSNREHRADEVLRAQLGRQRGREPDLGRVLSRAVFDYYRWFGWLDPQQPLTTQIIVAGELQEQFVQRPEAFTDEELLSKAIPAWVTDQVALSGAWARSLQSQPRLWLRARPGKGGVLARSLQAKPRADTGPLADTLEYLGSEDLFRTREFHAGEFELQDISSQCVGLICDPKAGEKWWDVCVGEGGKMLHLSDLMQNQGLIWASDRAAWRLAKLRRRAARARVFNYRCAVWNGGVKLPTRTQFDGVLVDAPCSGIGTWQRHPHARWTTQLQDVHELSRLQSDLLSRAAQAVKPGGKLVYSVCTLARAETVEAVEGFAKGFPEFTPLAILNPLRPAQPQAAPLWFWPQECGGNGMFVAAWRR